jgi:hypothetical protein
MMSRNRNQINPRGIAPVALVGSASRETQDACCFVGFGNHGTADGARHDAAMYLAFRPYMKPLAGTLKKIDQAMDMISSSGETPDKKQAAVAVLDKGAGGGSRKGGQG